MSFRGETTTLVALLRKNLVEPMGLEAKRGRPFPSICASSA